MNAVVRRTTPANSQFDGDLVFACSTASAGEPAHPSQVLRIGLCAEWALDRAIERAVTAGRG